MTSSRTTSRLALVAAMGAIALAATACGPSVAGSASGSDAESGSSASGTDYSGVTPAKEITFWTNHPGGSIDTENAIIKAFTEETGITVDLVTAGANYEEVAQKFQTAQTSGDVGDVVVLSDATWFPAYLAGSITPIDPILKAADADTSTYQETLYNDYLFEGSHYAVPYARSTPIFYYNKDMFKAAGLEDKAPATWDDVKAAAEKLAAANSGVTGFGFPQQDQYPAWTMANLVWGYGGSWSDEWDFSPIADDATVKALTFAQDGVKDGWASVVSGDPATAFSAGTAAMVIGSTGSLTGILDAATFDVGVGELPAGPEASEGIVPTGGAGVAISSKSSPEKQLAAAQFVSYLTNAENTATFSAATGYLPVRTDADMNDVYSETPAFKVAVEQLAKTRSQDFARALLPGGDLAISKAIQQILTTDADPASTLSTLRDDLQGTYDSQLKDQLGGN
ncbi:MAG: ABC transporter substrate-binding protein [Actinomyces sp.]|nr:ABC transporter substrate-binding protein [Actinomyces sp.]MCI1642346.1 ABC transporter substrate-binding protein [Actinomyces sp.]MCI1662686.1 ABC transporter substrate-binding protein [Actinomyces sp.]MCI1691490.1 ABC transporter substrate-binding protein [Actinomyces sp.]MCI1867212.1 ABC transporter substrate-binding protein [Actinomyces sp.]